VFGRAGIELVAKVITCDNRTGLVCKGESFRCSEYGCSGGSVAAQWQRNLGTEAKRWLERAEESCHRTAFSSETDDIFYFGLGIDVEGFADGLDYVIEHGADLISCAEPVGGCVNCRGERLKGRSQVIPARAEQRAERATRAQCQRLARRNEDKR